jgi:single-strand DNA-binding protein
MRYTPNGRPVTQFSVAVSNSKPDGQGGWVDEGTDWYRVSIFGDRAERAAEQLRKGNRVFVEGRFKTREFEGNDGQKRTSLDVTADNVISLDRKGQVDDSGAFTGAPVASAGGGAPSRAPSDDTDLDDLPF